MKTSYVVTAPYVTLKRNQETGGQVITGFYEGAVLPDDVDQESLDRHIEKGMVAKADSDEGRLAAPAGTPKPGEPPNVAVTEQPAVARPLAERQKAQAEAAKGDKAKAADARAEAKEAKAADAKATPDPKAAEDAKAPGKANS